MAGQIQWEEKGILFIHKGTVDDAEVMELNNIMYGDPRFDNITYQISDYTLAEKILLTQTDARVIGTLDRVSSHWTTRKMKVAVVTRDPEFIPMANHYFEQFEGTPWEGRIFGTLDEAYAWVRA